MLVMEFHQFFNAEELKMLETAHIGDPTTKGDTGEGITLTCMVLVCQAPMAVKSSLMFSFAALAIHM